jgi:hypothetical protein
MTRSHVTKQQRDCWRRCLLCGQCRGYIAKAIAKSQSVMARSYCHELVVRWQPAGNDLTQELENLSCWEPLPSNPGWRHKRLCLCCVICRARRPVKLLYLPRGANYKSLMTPISNPSPCLVTNTWYYFMLSIKNYYKHLVCEVVQYIYVKITQHDK